MAKSRLIPIRPQPLQPIQPNPFGIGFKDLFIVGGIAIAALVVLGKVAEGSGKVSTRNGIKMAPTIFDTIFRIGDRMHIVWNFQHKGPAQDVVLAFGVASHVFGGVFAGPLQQPFQTLEKNVHLNADDDWVDYSIDHAWTLDSLRSAGHYDAISYIRTSSGRVLDEQRYYASITAI